MLLVPVGNMNWDKILDTPLISISINYQPELKVPFNPD